MTLLDQSPASPDAVEAKPPRPATTGFILRKLVWGLALVGMVIAGANGMFTFEIQTGAPQQAAAAAVSCFHMITIYVLARALDQLLRSQESLG